MKGTFTPDQGAAYKFIAEHTKINNLQIKQTRSGLKIVQPNQQNNIQINTKPAKSKAPKFNLAEERKKFSREFTTLGGTFDKGAIGITKIVKTRDTDEYVLLKVPKKEHKEDYHKNEIKSLAILKRLLDYSTAPFGKNYLTRIIQKLYNGVSLVDVVGNTANTPKFDQPNLAFEVKYLKEYLATQNKPYLSLYQRVKIALNICIEFTRIIKKNILHHDIKPENILVLPDLTCKSVDFGFSDITKKRVSQHQYIKGTPLLHAYEIMQQHPRTYSEKSMVYSIGASIALMFNYDSYDGVNTAVTQEYIKAKSNFSVVNEAYKKSMGTLFGFRPHQELSNINYALTYYDPKYSENHPRSTKIKLLRAKKIIYQACTIIQNMMAKSPKLRPTIAQVKNEWENLLNELIRLDINEERHHEAMDKTQTNGVMHIQNAHSKESPLHFFAYKKDTNVRKDVLAKMNNDMLLIDYMRRKKTPRELAFLQKLSVDWNDFKITH